jgi:hypothetical protein
MPVDPPKGVAGGADATGAVIALAEAVSGAETAEGKDEYIGLRGSLSVPEPTIGIIAITRSYIFCGSTIGCADAASNDASRHTTGMTALRMFMRLQPFWGKHAVFEDRNEDI